MDPTVNIAAEWGAVKGAPYLSFGILIAVIVLVWTVIHFIYRQRLERLKEALQNEQAESTRLRGRVSEYEAKAGRTPDEAHARIEMLETRLKSVEPRVLTPAQREKLTAAMRPFEGGHVQIDADADAHEAVNLQQLLLQAFSAANWNISQSQSTIVYGQEERTPGMVLFIHNPASPTAAEIALMRELDGCGLEYRVRENLYPGIRIFITARF